MRITSAAASVALVWSSWATALGLGTASVNTLFAGAINSLARNVACVESVREIKDVQRLFAQLAQYGRWDDMAALFADNGTLKWGRGSDSKGKGVGAGAE